MSILTGLILILIAAVGGYAITSLFIHMLFGQKRIFGFRTPGLLPTVLPHLADYLSGALKDRFAGGPAPEATFLHPSIMQDLKPELENHIDVFLKNKLPKAIPLLAGLMGEKTTSILKTAFLEEVETIFPDVMKSIGAKTAGSTATEKILQKEIGRIDVAAIERIVREKAKSRLRILKIGGAVAGAVIGIVQVLILLAILNG